MAEWSIHEVAEHGMVEPLGVLPGLAPEDAAFRELSQRWMVEEVWPARLLAASGPDIWAHPSSSDGLPLVEVGEVVAGPASVSFTVDRVGVPMLVKVSYAPGWSVTGADGPFRVTPNLMVVVPTDERVTLDYGATMADRVGWGTSTLGMAALGCVAIIDRRDRRKVDR